jgi:hypothetical protein
MKKQELTQEQDQSKWHWMMDYCKLHQNSPGQKWAWDDANEVHEKYIMSCENEN